MRALQEAQAKEANVPYQEVTAEITQIKAKLHRLRLSAGRKEFSIKTRERALAEVRKALTDCREQEATMVEKLEDLERQEKAISDQLAREAAKK